MKKIFFSLSLIFATCALFALPSKTDVIIYDELLSSYTSAFYPGVVQHAEELFEEFPSSSYIPMASVLEGESLVRLGQIDSALELLLDAEKLNLKDELLLQQKFWLARAYEKKNDAENSLIYYFDYCRLAGEEGKYFAQAIFHSADVYYRIGEYKKALSNLEYVIKNGNKFSSQDYGMALLELADSYNKTGNSEKTISLYSRFNGNDLKNKIYLVLTEYTGDAYAKQKNYRKAYELYCQVLAGGEKVLAANALKKSYNVSSEHRKEVGAEPGEVLKNAQNTLASSPELLAEFWTRLGIDAFNSGDYQKAASYFDESEKFSAEDLRLMSYAYRAEMIAGKKITDKSAFKAQEYVKKTLSDNPKIEESSLKYDFYRLLVKYAAAQSNWEDVKKYASIIPNPDDSTNYYLALAQYESGDYTSSAKLLSGKNDQLYALTLARQQKLKEAAGVYGSADKKSPISAEERLNYAKVLILSGRYREAQIEAEKSGLNEGKYILGLAQFNTWSWPYAEESFSIYLKNVDSSDESQKKPLSYARFYQAYAQYRQGKAEKAYNNLLAFSKTYPNHELYWNALITAANAAVQMGNLENGIQMAEEAVKASANNENREEAVLMCADIYSDSKRYESALNLLSPYSKLKNSFGMKSLFKMAQIFEKMGQIEQADSKYREVASKFSAEKNGEEAMYRRGEIYYAAAKYDDALTRFSDYSSKYPNGLYIDSSWYFTADCLSRLGKNSRAILQYQALVKKFPESTYVYGSSKKLIELYRLEGKYANALENARFLISKYGDQARNDGIGEVAADLEKLASGKNEAMVKKENEYRKAGGANTPEGRKAGTELAIMYAKSPASSDEAIKMAEKFLPLQKKNLKQESLWAAQNADILAQAYRAQGKNKAASEMYLAAAEYYRMNSKGGEAAAALYGAYDSFIAQGLPADANETAKALKELYPETRQAKAVKIDN
ncbi:MAG: tetratricopeptide repeat protein [Treponema sp.]|nr:tetratricopeptide repeat protein [Treponema sp.]